VTEINDRRGREDWSERSVTLPEGVSESQWEEERETYQDPRLRAFLDCLRLLDEVPHSDYSILNCSPARLREIWSKTQGIADLIGNRIAPLLETTSCIPRLEKARSNAQVAVEMLESTTLSDLAKFPVEIAPDSEQEIRRLLCFCTGQLQDFVQDTCGQLLAKDPRRLDDTDLFLSRGFLQRVDEAEYLHDSVRELLRELEHLGETRHERLTAAASQIEEQRRLPDAASWQQVVSLLSVLQVTVIPRLKRLLAMRGVRVDEMGDLDRYAMDISNACSVLQALYELGREADDEALASLEEGHQSEPGGSGVLASVRWVLSRRLVSLMRRLDEWLHDLTTFVPLWLQGIEKRRALMFSSRRHQHSSSSHP
jgi:hypothetical protein